MPKTDIHPSSGAVIERRVGAEDLRATDRECLRERRIIKSAVEQLMVAAAPSSEKSVVCRYRLDGRHEQRDFPQKNQRERRVRDFCESCERHQNESVVDRQIRQTGRRQKSSDERFQTGATGFAPKRLRITMHTGSYSQTHLLVNGQAPRLRWRELGNRKSDAIRGREHA